MNLPKQKGFTLIELLIVIVIIGVMAGILVAVVNVDEQRKMARDARRVNDMHAIHIALTTTIANSGIRLVDTSACADCDSFTGTTDTDGTGWVKFTDISGVGLRDVIPKLPKDPVNDATYNLQFYSDGMRFELNTTFESGRYVSVAQEDGGNDPDVYERGWDLTLN